MKKADVPNYRGLHNWVERKLGKPRRCEKCLSTTGKWYHWANISREYRKDLSDWKRLCTKCHTQYDYNGKCRSGEHEMIQGNLYINPNSGGRTCLTCKRNLRKEQYQRFKLQKEGNRE